MYRWRAAQPTVSALPWDGLQIGGCGCCSGRGHGLTYRSLKWRPYHSNGPGRVQASTMRSCASWNRLRDWVGSSWNVWYSAPMPRTKPEMTRPPEMTSSMAISSATRSGWSRSEIALPRTAIFPLVCGTSAAATTSGAGMRPYAV